MDVKVNACGLQCPIPVIQAKKALEDMKEAGTVEVLVDNEVAVQNLMKLAGSKNLEAASEKLEEKVFAVRIAVDGPLKVSDMEETVCIPDSRKKRCVVVLSSNCMGSGAEELGKTLMKGFVLALSKQDTLPETVLLYNSGAYLSCEGSDSVEDLKVLEAEGVEILTCGTCLNYYGLSEKLAVGTVTNMYDIVEKMTQATSIVRP